MDNESTKIARRALIKSAAMLAVTATARAQAQTPAADAATTLSDVPLSTVSWSREDQGKAAAELLLERIEGDARGAPALPKRVVIPPRLVVRRSSRGK